MTAPSTAPRVVLLVVCAAPPAQNVGELVTLLHADAWDVHIVTTPTARQWIDEVSLTDLTGHPVNTDSRRPDDPKYLPSPDAVVVAPATFNTINKWAAGINDTLALGILNEMLGSQVSVVIAPYAKAVLGTHPAFVRSLQLLRSAGASITSTEAIKPTTSDGPFQWQVVIDELRSSVGRDI